MAGEAAHRADDVAREVRLDQQVGERVVDEALGRVDGDALHVAARPRAAAHVELVAVDRHGAAQRAHGRGRPGDARAVDGAHAELLLGVRQAGERVGERVDALPGAVAHRDLVVADRVALLRASQVTVAVSASLAQLELLRRGRRHRRRVELGDLHVVELDRRVVDDEPEAAAGAPEVASRSSRAGRRGSRRAACRAPRPRACGPAPCRSRPARGRPGSTSSCRPAPPARAPGRCSAVVPLRATTTAP